MRISYHAAQRFLERVINPKTFSKEDVYHAQAYLQRLLKDVVINSYKKKFVIPEFQHFLGVYQENVLVTIIPKDRKEEYRLSPVKRYGDIREY